MFINVLLILWDATIVTVTLIWSLNKCLTVSKATKLQWKMKDTVSTDEEDDEVDGNQDAWNLGPSIGHDSVIHDVCPLLSCQDLRGIPAFIKDSRRFSDAAQRLPGTH